MKLSGLWSWRHWYWCELQCACGSDSTAHYQ